MRLLTLSLFIISGVFTLSSCKKEDTNTDYTTSKGAAVEVGEGHAQTSITINHAGVPQEIGVVFTNDALVGLPDVNTLYVLNLPPEAIEATLFKNVVVGLSAHGHVLPPTGKIDEHFDVRFFMMSNEERLAIPAPASSTFPAGGGFDVTPMAGYLPPNYVMNSAAAQIG